MNEKRVDAEYAADQAEPSDEVQAAAAVAEAHPLAYPLVCASEDCDWEGIHGQKPPRGPCISCNACPMCGERTHVKPGNPTKIMAGREERIRTNQAAGPNTVSTDKRRRQVREEPRSAETYDPKEHTGADEIMLRMARDASSADDTSPSEESRPTRIHHLRSLDPPNG